MFLIFEDKIKRKTTESAAFMLHVVYFERRNLKENIRNVEDMFVVENEFPMHCWVE